MKNIFLHIILIFSIITVFFSSSCVNEISFSQSQTAPELVVNCLITPDSIVKLNLSLSKFFLSSESSYIVIKNHEVKLWINDVLKETMLFKNNIYVSVYKPKIGDIIKITFKNPDNQKISYSQTIIQKRVPIISIDSNMTFLSSNYLVYNNPSNTVNPKTDSLGFVRDFKINFKLNFKDSLKFENYYRIIGSIIHYYADGKSANIRLKIKPDDVVFEKINESEIFDNNSDKLFNIFNDNAFDGNAYGIKTFLFLKKINIKPENLALYKTAGYKIPIKTELVFDLQSISPELFAYLKTVKDNNTDLQYLSEPVQVYNNIVGGLGILGCYTHSYYKFTLPNNSETYFYQ